MTFPKSMCDITTIIATTTTTTSNSGSGQCTNAFCRCVSDTMNTTNPTAMTLMPRKLLPMTTTPWHLPRRVKPKARRAAAIRSPSPRTRVARRRAARPRRSRAAARPRSEAATTTMPPLQASPRSNEPRVRATTSEQRVRRLTTPPRHSTNQ
jgi:hypothetical protein